MYDVLDVSRYIINYCNKKNYYIHNLKLQKILYFVQAGFLIKTDNPCFYQKIEARDYGPIVPKSYREFKRFGECLIPEIKTYITPDDRDIHDIWKAEIVPFDEDIITKKDKKLINEVVDLTADYSMVFLNDLIMKQKPWIDANVKNNQIITTKSLKKYFKNEE